jgi:RimJ/RimL family protein N-acetyltransferase
LTVRAASKIVASGGVSKRGQGYGLAAVSAATEWILGEGEVAVYGAYADNIASLRIARRLGFQFLQQEMGI